MGILADGRQLPQCGACTRGDMVKLPPDLLVDGFGSVRGGQSCRVGRIGGGTEGVRAHMRDASAA